MIKKKIFIFFTSEIITIGGMQMYVAGKANYLQNRNWQVYVFFEGPREAKSAIPYLTQYIKSGGGMNFFSTPPYKMKKYEQNYYLSIMLDRLELYNANEYEIIIESHADILGYWAELLAAQIGARHFFICCNEIYRPTQTLPNKTYEDNLDFFYFKWQRNELVGSKSVINKLFNGYKGVTKTLVEIPDNVREQDAIQDVDFPIEKIHRADWNICHIGRAMKDYVPSVIEGVGELARRYPNRTINFIMVGNADVRQVLLEQTFHNLPNVLITLLGDLVPIPRVLFTKIDVVCAISQSARFAANEDILTIVGSSSEPTRTPGVLGYDVKEQVYGKGTFSYLEALENVLVKKIYTGKSYILPKLKPAEEYYDNFWTIVKNASPVKEYYVPRLSQERIRTWTAIFPFGTVGRGARVIFFGKNEITKDYQRQIESQNNTLREFRKDYAITFKPCPYCQVVATIDEHPEDFDDTVVGIERLNIKDYDVIVICSFPQNAQAAYNKIIQIVPDMSDKVIYNFQITQT